MTATSTDIRNQVATALDGQNGFDLDGIVAELIQTYDLTGDAPADRVASIDEDEFWAIVARHDTAGR